MNIVLNIVPSVYMLVQNRKHKANQERLAEQQREREREEEYERNLFDIMAQIDKMGAEGSIVCPFCKGTIHFGKCSGNGHLHAVCSTKNCIKIME